MPTITHTESIVLLAVSLGKPGPMAGFKSADRPRPLTPIPPVPTQTQLTHNITHTMPEKNRLRDMPDQTGLRDKANMTQPHGHHAHDDDD